MKTGKEHNLRYRNFPPLVEMKTKQNNASDLNRILLPASSAYKKLSEPARGLQLFFVAKDNSIHNKKHAEVGHS
eukprot:1162119-Pelagomonas_calceolata.AAC.4